MCPDDDKCLCRAWAEAAKLGREHGLFFVSLTQDLDPDKAREWEAVAVDPRTGEIIAGGATDHPSRAMHRLADRMLAYLNSTT